MKRVKHYKGATKKCVYGTCKSDSRYKKPDQNYMFTKFPQPCLHYRKKEIVDSEVENHLFTCAACTKALKWLKFCKRSDGRFSTLDKITKDKYICSLHGKPDGDDTVDNDGVEGEVNVLNTDIENPQVFYVQIVTKGDLENVDPIPANFENDIHPPQPNKVSFVQEKVEEKQMKSTKSQTTFRLKNMEMLKNKIADKKTVIKQLLFEKKRSKQQRGGFKGFLKKIKSNKKQCHFYTGLSYEHLVVLYNFLQPSKQKLVYWKAKYYIKVRYVNINEKNRPFNYFEELVLTLVRLRGGLLVEDLSYRFEISMSHLSRIITTWLQFMYLEFKEIQQDMFPSREKIRENLPGVFRKLKNIRVIVDAAEFFCEVPSNFEHQGNLYSSYKHHTTYKVLLGTTPNGCVSFISKLFEGTITDNKLFENSGLIKLLEEGDLVMADRGFEVSEMLNVRGIGLNIPPFLKGRFRLTPQEEVETKRIAKERIYVEHVVGRLKKFRIFSRVIPLNLRGVVSQMVYVCGCLINFQPPVLTQ